MGRRNLAWWVHSAQCAHHPWPIIHSWHPLPTIYNKYRLYANSVYMCPLKSNKYRDGGQWNRTVKRREDMWIQETVLESQVQLMADLWSWVITHSWSVFRFVSLHNILFSSPMLMILSFNAFMHFLWPGKNIICPQQNFLLCLCVCCFQVPLSAYFTTRK